MAVLVDKVQFCQKAVNLVKWTTAQVKSQSNHLFEKHQPMMSLYQTLAEHFYPERADFTTTRNIGQELADSLVDSYPVLVRRDLGNSFNAMLRDGDWFNIGIDGTPDHLGASWLQHSTRRLRKLMGSRESNFVRATKEGDHDYATFGQTVISVEMNKKNDGLLFRCWHLRDVAWFDDESGQVGGVVRRWKPTYHQLDQTFGEDKLHENCNEKVKTNPFKEANITHMVLPSDMYGDEKIESKFPYVSIYIDMDNEHIIEEVGMNHKMYVVPRFQTIAGSQYAYSPATVVGLPDARALQSMTHTLLEAGERYARPPIIATQKVIRGDVDLAPDGITWVDNEYDEKMGASLRPLSQDRGGFPIGLEMRENIVEVLSSAFYLNKLSLPDTNRDMTAYEVSERMKQFRRENLPLFAPIESEYNGQLCEIAFSIAMSAGFFGSPMDIPDSLKGREVQFRFISPLSQSEEEERANKFAQTSKLLAEAAQFDQGVELNVNFDEAVRDAVMGIGAPASWLANEEEVEVKRQQIAMQQAAMAAMEQGVTGGQ